MPHDMVPLRCRFFVFFFPRQAEGGIEKCRDDWYHPYALLQCQAISPQLKPLTVAHDTSAQDEQRDAIPGIVMPLAVLKFRLPLDDLNLDHAFVVPNKVLTTS